MSRLIKESGELVLPLLKAIDSAADIFGPLKSATGGALHIIDLVQKFKSNRQEWVTFGQYIADTIVGVVYFLPDLKEQPDVLQNGLITLKSALDDIRKEIEAVQSQRSFERILNFLRDPELIDNMKKKLDDASKLYLLNQSMSTGINVVKMFSVMDTHLASIHEKMNKVADTIAEHIEETAILNLLPYATGASWNPDLVCLPNTRQAIIEDIWTWIRDPDPATPPLFWLSGVAGSGKSAIAHSVAQKCALPNNRASLSLSCFFFSLDKQERNMKLFSTIATDLLKISEQFAVAVADAIKADRSLLTASISRQFDDLILSPSLLHPPDRPVVIIIDALDEGYSEELLKLLRTKFHRLPSMFRILVTSRPDIKIDMFLSQSESIRKRYMNIDTDDNLDDITLYSRHRLEEVSSLRNLKDWPDIKLLDDFARKADGLILWVATVSNFLIFIIDPKRELQELIYGSHSAPLSAEDRMDELYSAILSRCNWQDRTFSKGYVLLIGAILAAKVPLPIRAWQSFHPDVPVRDILLSAGSLLSGLEEDTRPVRILHQSFRDFSSVPPSASIRPPYYIDVTSHRERLALLCLKALNEGLAQNIEGLGYLTTDSDEGRDIPLIHADAVSDELWYACCYWMDHVADVVIPAQELVDALQHFLETHLVDWMELSTSRGRFQNLDRFWTWRKDHALLSLGLPSTYLNVDFCKKIKRLSIFLSHMDRREEALAAAQEVTAAYRDLVVEVPEQVSSDLAASVFRLANCMYELGHREPALSAIQEAVVLHRELARQDPKKFDPDLAKSINELSAYLYELGRNEQALEAIQEAVTLHRELARQDPEKFNSDLATCLNNLSTYLVGLGHKDKALEVMKEAVVLHRELARLNPQKFRPAMAMTLNNLSYDLFLLHRNGQALEVIQEVVTIRRELALQHPKKLDTDLAMALSNLSYGLFLAGNNEQALELMQEVIALYNEFVRQYPKKYKLELAMSFYNLSLYLYGLGRSGEALEIMQDAFGHFKELAHQYPNKVDPDIASFLYDFSFRLSNIDHNEQAPGIIQEAFAFFKELAGQYPNIDADLISSFQELSARLSSFDHTEEPIKQAL